MFLSFFRPPIGVNPGLKLSTDWINLGLEAKMASKLGQLVPLKEATWRLKAVRTSLGCRICQLEREKMGHVGRLLAYASHPKAPGS